MSANTSQTSYLAARITQVFASIISNEIGFLIDMHRLGDLRESLLSKQLISNDEAIFLLPSTEPLVQIAKAFAERMREDIIQAFLKLADNLYEFAPFLLAGACSEELAKTLQRSSMVSTPLLNEILVLVKAPSVQLKCYQEKLTGLLRTSSFTNKQSAKLFKCLKLIGTYTIAFEKEAALKRASVLYALLKLELGEGKCLPTDEVMHQKIVKGYLFRRTKKYTFLKSGKIIVQKKKLLQNSWRYTNTYAVSSCLVDANNSSFLGVASLKGRTKTLRLRKMTVSDIKNVQVFCREQNIIVY